MKRWLIGYHTGLWTMGLGETLSVATSSLISDCNVG